MRDDLCFARELEHTILAAIAEDRVLQLDLPGLIDDLATTYEEIITQLRRRYERHGSTGHRHAKIDCLLLPHAEHEQSLIEEEVSQ